MRPLLFAFVLISATSIAQSTQPALEARLLHAPLYLRGLYAADKLQFDSAGQLQSKSAHTSFTLDGVDIRSVQLQSDRITIKGVRIGLKFVKDSPVRVTLVGTGFSGEEHLQIEILTPAGADYSQALDAVFTANLADLVPRLPVEWQTFAHQHILGEPPPAASVSPVRRIGGAIRPPKILFAADPHFSADARAAKITGNVLIYCQVGTDGQPAHVRILRPLGLGLDELSVLAVEQYKFQPAMENGSPVPVEMNIEVNFQIF